MTRDRCQHQRTQASATPVSLPRIRVALQAFVLTAVVAVPGACRSAAGERTLHVSYDVVPVRQAWSRRADWRGITQEIKCDFDSLVACELFTGAVPDGGTIALEVSDAADGRVVARSSATARTVGPGWLSFDRWARSGGFVRGRHYRFRFSRSGGRDFDYYWDPGNPYAGGRMLDSARDGPTGRDLACRILAAPVILGSELWGTHVRSLLYFDTTWHGGIDSVRAASLAQSAASAGLSWDRNYVSMQSLLPRPGVTRTTPPDAPMDRAILTAARHGMRILPCLRGSAFWATSANTTRPKAENRVWRWPGFTRWHNRLPVGLESPVGGTGRRRNPFAEFAAGFIGRYGPSDRQGFYGRNGLHAEEFGCCYVELWNEPNVYFVRGPDRASGHLLFPDPGVDGRLDSIFFAGPDRVSPPWSRTAQWRRCSLYVRLCQVVDSVRRRVDPRTKLLAGGVAGVRAYAHKTPYGYGDDILVRGDTWLQWFFELGGHRFVDGIAVHPFQLGWGREGYKDRAMWADMVFLDSLLGAHGARDLELWVTEIPFFSAREPGASEMRQAASLLAFCVSGVTGLGSALKTYDRIIQYTYVDDSSASGYEPAGFLTHGLHPKLSYRLIRRMVAALAGCRYTGRFHPGTDADSLSGVYEFECDSERRWLCWRNGNWVRRRQLELPVRTDAIAVLPLTVVEADTERVAVSPDGWFRHERWDSIPLLVAERGEAARPDLVVDSVWLEPAEPEVGRSLTVRAAVRNTGNRATPRGYRTAVRFSVEGESTGTVERAVPIRVGGAAEFELTIERVPLSMRGPGLLAVVVNPGQRYVELDIENNTGYAYAEIR